MGIGILLLCQVVMSCYSFLRMQRNYCAFARLMVMLMVMILVMLMVMLMGILMVMENVMERIIAT